MRTLALLGASALLLQACSSAIVRPARGIASSEDCGRIFLSPEEASAKSLVVDFFKNYDVVLNWPAFMAAQRPLLAAGMKTRVVDPSGEHLYDGPDGYFASLGDWSKSFETVPTDFGVEIVEVSANRVVARSHGTIKFKTPIYGLDQVTDQQHQWTEVFKIEDGRIAGLEVLMNILHPHRQAGFLSDIPSDSPEFRRISTRFPDEVHSIHHDKGGPNGITTYLAKVHEVLRQVFEPWFENPESMSFQELYDAQWAAMTGDASYTGHHYTEQIQAMIYGPENWDPNHLVGRGHRTGPQFLPIEPKHLRAPELFELFDLVPRDNSGVEVRSIPIEGIPEEFWPKIELKGGGRMGPMLFNRNQAKFHYPPPEAFPHYFARMAELMGEIVPLAKRVSTNEEREQLLTLLAKYYKVGISAQFFDRVNNSLLMSQVNYILMRAGMRGVPHRDLDYLAVGLPAERLIPIFIKDVQDEQARP